MPIDGIIDDLRVYNECLALNDVQASEVMGGGDFNRIELIGAGQKRELKLIKRGIMNLKKRLPLSITI